MRKQALIWTYIGMILQFIGEAIPAIIYMNYGTAGLVMGFIYLALALLTAIFGTLMIKSIKKNTKKSWLGVMGILFCSIIGGIMYLIWNPANENPTVAVAQTGEASHNIENKLEAKAEAPVKENVADELLKLKELKDAGAITEEEYEAKKADLVKKL